MIFDDNFRWILTFASGFRCLGKLPELMSGPYLIDIWSNMTNYVHHQTFFNEEIGWLLIFCAQDLYCSILIKPFFINYIAFI